MADPGFSYTPSATSQPVAVEQKSRVLQALKGSASWFGMIAGLSVVNSILAMSGTSVRFIFGLGLSQIVDRPDHQWDYRRGLRTLLEFRTQRREMGVVSRHGRLRRGRPPSAALQRLSRHRLPRVRSLPDVVGVKIAPDPRASEPAERDRGYFGFLLSAPKSGAQAQPVFEAYP